jgi:hypothetical protein
LLKIIIAHFALLSKPGFPSVFYENSLAIQAKYRYDMIENICE